MEVPRSYIRNYADAIEDAVVGPITSELVATLEAVDYARPIAEIRDEVIKVMNAYCGSAAELSARVSADYYDGLRERMPDITLTSDIIVGFPTETEEDFLQSLSMVEEAGFSQIHAFPYSPREGTNAYKRYKELPAAVKKERVARMLEAGAKQKERYLRGCIGREEVVVPELCIGGYTEGYAANYVRVYIAGDVGKEPTLVRITGLLNDGVLAEKIEK